MKKNRIRFEYGSHGSIMCDLELGGSSYRKPITARVFPTKSEEYDYGIRFNVQHLDYICRANSIPMETLVVTNAEPITWYELDLGVGMPVRSRSLSKSFLYTWENFDYPTIYQCWTSCGQIENGEPVQGEMLISLWSNVIEIGEYATETDLKRIRSYLGEGGRISQYIETYLESKQMKPGDGDAARRRVEDFEHSINDVIERNREAIVTAINENEPELFCMDCGWIKFYPEDVSLAHDYELLRALGQRYSNEVRINFPYVTQSTTAEGIGARLLQGLVWDELHAKIGFYAQLD